MATQVAVPPVQKATFRPYVALAAIVHVAVAGGLIFLGVWAIINLRKVEGEFPPFPGVLFSMGGLLMEAGAGGLIWLGFTVALALRKRWARWILMAASTVWLVPSAFLFLTLDFKRATVTWELLGALACLLPITVLALPQLGREMRA